jgi:glutaredoxin
MGKFVIYSLSECYWSEKAKHLFNSSKTKHKVINVLRKVKNNYNKIMTTFPQIYYVSESDKALIGGYEEFIEILTSKMLSFRIPPKKDETRTIIQRKIETEFLSIIDFY